MVKRSATTAFGPLASGFVPYSKRKLNMRRKRKIPPVKGALLSKKELNYIDIAKATYAADTTGTITLLNGCAEGDDNTQRNGRKAKMVSIQVNAYAFAGNGNTIPQKVRFLLVWDNAPSGAAPTVANILSAVDSISFPLVDNEDRFTILRDVKMVLGINSNTATQALADQTAVPFDFYKKINTDSKFNGTGATITSIQNGALWGVTVGNLAAGATAGSIVYATRVRFTDI